MMRTSSPANPVKVVVYEHLTSGGMSGFAIEPAWLEEGRQMRQTAVDLLESAGCEVITLTDHRLKDEFPGTSLIIDSQDQLHQAILEMIGRTDFGLCVAPETDGILLDLTKRIDSAPGWNLGCSADAVALCGDKLALSKFLKNHDIAHPETWSADDPAQPWQFLPGPFFVKPRDGAGSLETFRVSSAAQIAQLTTHAPERFVVQNSISGKSMSLSVLADGTGKSIPVGVCEHRLKTESTGMDVESFLTADGVFRPDFDPQRCRNSLEALNIIDGLKGWVGVDFIWDEANQCDSIIEINPRLTMSCCWISQSTSLVGLIRRWLEILLLQKDNDLIRDGNRYLDPIIRDDLPGEA